MHSDQRGQGRHGRSVGLELGERLRVLCGCWRLELRRGERFIGTQRFAAPAQQEIADQPISETSRNSVQQPQSHCSLIYDLFDQPPLAGQFGQ
ncbi:hypothetical protein AB7M56_006983 [Bradyrhizobium elkanii]|jgi:hypothetical protein|nr:hypothetical protein [Bradyrhizobium elkanii]MCS3520159.1 hypothetical protein [Bradyrhizobium elkanii]MCS4067814.1 hypothetical protein [Bradyrhizobium elkanii]MCS4083350.1 hypothetical protein [Bradyrhizobium elkanii]MCS4105534.1 hypothetical protein [Bradyrhizobium elkanii]